MKKEALIDKFRINKSLKAIKIYWQFNCSHARKKTETNYAVIESEKKNQNMYLILEMYLFDYLQPLYFV